MKNNDFLLRTSEILQGNKVTTILALQSIDYDFNRSVGEQTVEVVDKLSQMLLESLSTGVPANVVEDNVEDSLKEVETSSIEDIESISTLQEDLRYHQLMELFNSSKVKPSKRKEKDKVVEQILDILIPATSVTSSKGRVLKDRHKRKQLLNIINASNSKEQLSNDLITYIDDFKKRVNKRNKLI